jgi:hypothetical protein
MSFLRARGPKTAEVPQLTGLQIQTSSNAVPIAIVYGNNKVAPNIIWTGDFQAIPEYTKAGGKGGGRKTLSGYNYRTAIAMGLCEGPIGSVGTIWNGQSVATLESLELGLFYGSTTQESWGYLSVDHAGEALPYRGLAYTVSGWYDLGQSGSIGSLQFEIYGLKSWTAVVNGRDADPAEVIYDFLINSQYGVQFPPESIDASTLFGSSGSASYQAYCRAAGLAISPMLSNKESANAILTRWLKLTNATAVWSGGKLKVVPYGDAPLTGGLYAGGSVVFDPNLTPAYHLNDDDFVGDADDDPIHIERKDPYSAFNLQTLEISYRWGGYNATPIIVWDQNAIEAYGRRDGPTITAHEICDAYIAQKIAQLILQREIYIRNTYAFRLSFEYCLLEPMDIVTLTDPALGLDHAAVRILSVEEDDDGTLNVLAEEFPGGTATAEAYPVEIGKGGGLDHNIAPAFVNAPVIFEPPASLTGGLREIWVAVSGGITMAYKLSEDDSEGTHEARADLPPVEIGTLVQFSVYLHAGERDACRLKIHDGSASQSVDFDLVDGISLGETSGITAASIAQVAGGPWYLLSITCMMTASAAPGVSIILKDVYGSTSYVGALGEGLYVWGAGFASGGGVASAIPMPMQADRATVEPSNTIPPDAVAGKADPFWGGCLIHASTDNGTFSQIGRVDRPARHGSLTEALEHHSEPGTDMNGVLAVDLTESGGELGSVSEPDAKAGLTLSLVGDELVAYSVATLTGPRRYDLTILMRGLHGTHDVSHTTGERFARLDDAIFKFALPAAYVGTMLYLKFQSFNIFGQALQDLAACKVYTFVPRGTGAGLGPVVQALALGTALDYGGASAAAINTDDFGLASESNVTIIDLGLASA